MKSIDQIGVKKIFSNDRAPSGNMIYYSKRIPIKWKLLKEFVITAQKRLETGFRWPFQRNLQDKIRPCIIINSKNIGGNRRNLLLENKIYFLT